MLLDSVMEDGLKPENDPHPQEGVLIGDTFLRLEEEYEDHETEIPKRDSSGKVVIKDPTTGEPEMEKITVPKGTGVFKLLRYNNVTTEEIVADEITDGEEVVKEAWDAATHFFDRQSLVLTGGLSQDELDDEIKNRSATDCEAEIDQHSTKAATPTEYEVECQVNGCCHINTIDSLEDGQTCEDCGEGLDIQGLQDAASTMINHVADNAPQPDDLKSKLAEIMKTIPSPEGLPHERLLDMLKYDLEEKYGIDDPDDSEIWEFINEVKKDDDTW